MMRWGWSLLALVLAAITVWSMYQGTTYLLAGRPLGCILHWAACLGVGDSALRVFAKTQQR